MERLEQELSGLLTWLSQQLDAGLDLLQDLSVAIAQQLTYYDVPLRLQIPLIDTVAAVLWLLVLWLSHRWLRRALLLLTALAAARAYGLLSPY